MKQIRSHSICFLILPVLLASCGANEGVLRSGKETPVQSNLAEEKPSFEKDLAAMRTAGFTFIYALRRHDGQPIAAEDIRVIKQSTVDTNRRVKSDNDRAVLVGSNLEVAKENLDTLRARFSFEDYSQPPPMDSTVNTNSNK